MDARLADSSPVRRVLPSSAVSSWWWGGGGGKSRWASWWERVRRPRKRRDPKPRSVVDFTGGPVADLTLRSTPRESRESITPITCVNHVNHVNHLNQSVHSSNNQKRPHNRRDPKPRRDRQTGNQKKKTLVATLARPVLRCSSTDSGTRGVQFMATTSTFLQTVLQSITSAKCCHPGTMFDRIRETLPQGWQWH